MRFAPVLLAVLALAAGCGEDDSSPPADPSAAPATTTEPAVPKTEWAEQADAICAEYSERIEEVGEPTDPAELGPFLQESARIAQEQVEALREPDPPEEQRELVERFLATLEEAAASLREFADATEANDQAAATEAIQESTAVNAQAVELAEELGLTVCGQT